jgi:hypothetical protein
VIAQEIVEDLKAANEQFKLISGDLSGAASTSDRPQQKREPKAPVSSF